MSLLRITSRLIASNSSPAVLWNQSRQVARWVAPTLREIRKRNKKIGQQQPQRRSNFIEWNYEAELYAFGMRLGEKFNPSLLQQAFVDRSYIIQEEMKQKSVGIENPELHLQDNAKLIQKGDEMMTEFIITYLNLSLPKLPRDGIKAIYRHLIADETLAHISSNLGTRDLIMSAEFPVTQQTFALNLKAIIGALFESSGEVRAYEFIRDFICTHLNQMDINELWNIENPMSLLIEICKDKKFGEPEPRLIGDVGKNTLLAAFNIGIYSNKRMLGSGYGESASIATNEAAKDCLRNLFKTNLNMKPFDFKMPISEIIKALNKAPIASVDKM